MYPMAIDVQVASERSEKRTEEVAVNGLKQEVMSPLAWKEHLVTVKPYRPCDISRPLGFKIRPPCTPRKGGTPPFQVAGFASKGPLALSVWVGGSRPGPVAGQAPRGSRGTPSLHRQVSFWDVWHRHIVMSCPVRVHSCLLRFKTPVPREASIADIKRGTEVHLVATGCCRLFKVPDRVHLALYSRSPRQLPRQSPQSELSSSAILRVSINILSSKLHQPRATDPASIASHGIHPADMLRIVEPWVPSPEGTAGRPAEEKAKRAAALWLQARDIPQGMTSHRIASMEAIPLARPFLGTQGNPTLEDRFSPEIAKWTHPDINMPPRQHYPRSSPNPSAPSSHCFIPGSRFFVSVVRRLPLASAQDYQSKGPGC
uniref:Related to micofilarial sheath protein n=1 Tax=Neurospora crassa TaxID=5141 RepID=Q8X0L0_NEUCS|nr:related to micofilarial sheath protein [Neurospora crassa]